MLQRTKFYAMLSFGFLLGLSACGGSSDPFAVVPDESPAEELGDTWDLTYTVTEQSGCEDLDIVVGESTTDELDFSEWNCDVDGTTTASQTAIRGLAASSTSDGDSDSDTYDENLECEAGGNVIVAQYTASNYNPDNPGCQISVVATNSVTLSEDGETLTGTQVVEMTVSGCTEEVDGIGNLSCHAEGSISGERVDPSSNVDTPSPIEEPAAVDADGDGYDTDSDCDDSNSAISPAATEVCDSVDNDCDDSIDENVKTTFYADVDGDGFGDAAATTDSCSQSTGYVTDATDCDDSSATVYPGATETAGDAIDQDCDGVDAEHGLGEDDDVDADGYTAETDCDDNNAAVYPGAEETVDGIDNDCDGTPDETSGLVTITIDSMPTSVVAGESFDVQVTVTNNSGLSDFLVEARIHDTTAPAVAVKGDVAVLGAPVLGRLTPSVIGSSPLGANFCTDSYPCTTLSSDPLSVAAAASQTYTFTGLTTSNAAGDYYFVVRVMVDGYEHVYARDYQKVTVTSAP